MIWKKKLKFKYWIFCLGRLVGPCEHILYIYLYEHCWWLAAKICLYNFFPMWYGRADPTKARCWQFCFLLHLPPTSSVFCRDPVIESEAGIYHSVPDFLLQNNDRYTQVEKECVMKIPKAGMTPGELSWGRRKKVCQILMPYLTRPVKSPVASGKQTTWPFFQFVLKKKKKVYLWNSTIPWVSLEVNEAGSSSSHLCLMLI